MNEDECKATLELRTPVVREAIRTLAVMTALAMPAHAFAADPIVSTGLPPVQWVGLGRAGDSTGSAGNADGTSALALEPLRLDLLRYQPLMPSAECAASAQAESLAGGSALRPMATLGTNLSRFGPARWAPRLTLFGFSRFGCALDAAAGGGATFTMPVRKDTLFVLSGGAIYLPQVREHKTTVRGDLVFSRANGRSFNIGVGSHGVSFGGVW
jgi:hypothetical protein